MLGEKHGKHSVAAILSVIGLLASMVGVLLLFWFGMPFRVPAQGTIIIAERPTLADLRTDTKHRLLSYLGLHMSVPL